MLKELENKYKNPITKINMCISDSLCVYVCVCVCVCTSIYTYIYRVL